MIGLGGGFVVVPILTFFGFSPQLAASNSLFAAFSNAVSSTATYAKQRRIEYSLGLKLGLLSVPGTIIGAYISDEITSSLFKILFGIVLLVSSLFGIGGGVVFVPLMVIAIGISMKMAAPTSQFILLFASASGMIAHALLGHPDFYQALFLSIGAFVGGLVGSRLSLQIEEKKLKIIVTVVLVITAIKLFIDSMGAPF